MNCPKCGDDAFLVNPKYQIYQCSGWDKKTCYYGCFYGSDVQTSKEKVK